MKSTVKAFFSSSTIIYVALNISIIIFMLLSFFINSNHLISTDFTNIFLIISIVLLFGAGLVSKILTNNLLKNIQEISINEKLLAYRKQMIFALALFEGVALFSIVNFRLSQNILSVGVAVICLILMLNYFPTKRKFIEICKLTKAEENYILDDDNIVNI